MQFSISRQIIAILLVATLWANGAAAKQPAKLGFAETVVGGALVLVEEKCAFQGLGTGYALYLTNARGSTIGKGCAIPDALPPELGMIMVQWGASQVHGAETYQIDDFKWTPRGHTVMAPTFKANHEAKVRIKTQLDVEAKEEAAEFDMAAAFNQPNAEKMYLAAISREKYPPIVLITPKQCRPLITEPDPSGEYSSVMVRKDNGRTALGLYSDSDKRIVRRGCALANVDSSISIKWDYEIETEPFSAEQISWEPKGQEWKDTKTSIAK